MNQFLKQILTGKDNNTGDIVRVLGLLFGLAIVIYEGYIVLVTKTFDVINFGIACSGLLAGIGAGIVMKKDTEPDNK